MFCCDIKDTYTYVHGFHENILFLKTWSLGRFLFRSVHEK